jgi:hypothetical protein
VIELRRLQARVQRFHPRPRVQSSLRRTDQERLQSIK